MTPPSHRFHFRYIENFATQTLAKRAVKMIQFIKMKIAEIGSRVAERRKSLGLLQPQLAELSGVSVHTLSNLESGSGNPTVANLLRVAEVLGFEVDLKARQV